jgi:hypothetical protein
MYSSIHDGFYQSHLTSQLITDTETLLQIVIFSWRLAYQNRVYCDFAHFHIQFLKGICIFCNSLFLIIKPLNTK